MYVKLYVYPIQEKVLLNNEIKLNADMKNIIKYADKKKIKTTLILFIIMIVYFALTYEPYLPIALNLLNLWYLFYYPYVINIGKTDKNNIIKWETNTKLTQLQKMYIQNKVLEEEKIKKTYHSRYKEEAI